MAGKKEKSSTLDFSTEDLRIDLEVKECKRNGYELKKVFLGKGNYAKVYLAKITAEKLKSNQKLKSMQKKNKSCEVAIKIVNLETASHAYINKFLPREVAAMSLNYENPNVVKMLDFFATPKRVYIVLEYARGGDLLRFVNKSDAGVDAASIEDAVDESSGSYGLPERRAREIFADVAHAVRHMHDIVGVAHRDLKCENILLMSENGAGRAKVSDFGFAAISRSEHREVSGRDAAVQRNSMMRNTHCGSFAYASPEVLMKTPNYDARAADMWSLGVVLFALVQGSLPFQETSAKGVLESMKKSLHLNSSSSNEYKRLLRALLRKKPTQRLTASALLKHPWLQLAGFTQTEDSKDCSKEHLAAKKTAKRKIRPHRPSNFDRPEFVTYCIRRSRTGSKDNQMSLLQLKRSTPFDQDTMVTSSTNSSFSAETKKRRSLESSVKRMKRPNTGTLSSSQASVIRYNLTKGKLISNNNPLKANNTLNEPINDQYWGPKIEYFLPVPHPSGAVLSSSRCEHLASENFNQPQQQRILQRPQFSLFRKIYGWHASTSSNNNK